jgi:hypothetical protein
VVDEVVVVLREGKEAVEQCHAEEGGFWVEGEAQKRVGRLLEEQGLEEWGDDLTEALQ